MTMSSPVRELVLSRNEVRNALDLATTERLLRSIAEARPFDWGLPTTARTSLGRSRRISTARVISGD